MTTEAASQQTADGIATTWLAEFTTALARRDVNAAAGLFARESYWRDLVSFSWNLTTVEHADGVGISCRQPSTTSDRRSSNSANPPRPQTV